MIRISKSVDTPPSLLREGNIKYDHQDVQNQLIEDHNEKCYVCERKCVTDYEIEHLKSSTNNPGLKTSWDNLFFSCKYCNGKKLHYFDNILNPSLHNVEEIIQCNHSSATKSVSFDSSQLDNHEVAETIRFLKRVFNGTNNMRVIKEERFYEYFLSRINHFSTALDKYLTEKTTENKAILIEELGIKQEFLAFKYHILKQREDLFSEFAPYMVWNRTI
jgi:small nuclear ribonucleoprotein (snRNP)-like protein